MKLYVNELMKEKELSVADEVSDKERIWDSRKELDTLIYQVTRALADRSHALGIALTNGHKLYHAGYANLLQMPEFYDIEVMRTVLSLIEEVSLLEEIFDYGVSENPIRIVYGSELGNKHLEPIGVIYMNFSVGDFTCQLGVLGCHRFDYPYIIPTMKYFRSLIEQITHQNT